MMVSSKGRYALQVMIDLAEHGGGDYIPAHAIAARLELSAKYLESIMGVLSRAGLVEGVHGKGGGYRLNIAPEACTVGRILKLTEGTLAPVSCLEQGKPCCAHAAKCRTLPLWSELDALIDNYLESVTVADLMQDAHRGDYVI